jgi:ribokinase
MIVAFGTINVDLVTEVSRFPVPGETVKGHDYAIHPGGKGANQALASRRAGADVVLCGAVGKDDFADHALVNLVAAGVDVSRVHRSASPTGLYMIAIDPTAENLMIGANAANNDARAQLLEPVFMAGDATRITLLTQNSLGVREVEQAIVLARSAGCRVVYNAAPAVKTDLATFRAADVVIVNEHEARTYADMFDLRAEHAAFARDFAKRIERDIVVTLGGEGMVASIGGVCFFARPPAITPVDTTGAGDAFCGALAAALDRGAPLKRAVLEGLASGSIACLKFGAQSSFGDRAAIETIADELHLTEV